MQLTIETISILESGEFPDFVQFERTEGELFFLNGGNMYGKPSEKINGDFSTPIWLESNEIGPIGENSIINLELKTLSGFGILGSYQTSDSQKMLIYEFAFEMDRYLDNGSIKHTIDTPVTTFTLNLENPHSENPEYDGNVAISEESSLLSPGSKVEFELVMGDSEPYQLGIFYVDRSNFSLLSETISIDGRNIIGKALIEQSFDEDNIYPYKLIHEVLNDIFFRARISLDEKLVENSIVYAGYHFDAKMSYLEGIMEILKALDGWKIKELVDGTIVVGSENFAGFTNNSRYTFYRDKDIFTRSIVRDDQEAYRRVCIHNQDYSIRTYRNVIAYSGWNLRANKTLYVNVPEGTSLTDAQKYADQIAISLQFVGKIESFTGPFRPQIILGDEAAIIGAKGVVNLGLITEVTHRFGKGGFYTDFTVDSGGRLGKGRLRDYIGKITKDKTSSSRIYE